MSKIILILIIVLLASCEEPEDLCKPCTKGQIELNNSFIWDGSKIQKSDLKFGLEAIFKNINGSVFIINSERTYSDKSLFIFNDNELIELDKEFNQNAGRIKFHKNFAYYSRRQFPYDNSNHNYHVYFINLLTGEKFSYKDTFEYKEVLCYKNLAFVFTSEMVGPEFNPTNLSKNFVLDLNNFQLLNDNSTANFIQNVWDIYNERILSFENLLIIYKYGYNNQLIYRVIPETGIKKLIISDLVFSYQQDEFKFEKYFKVFNSNILTSLAYNGKYKTLNFFDFDGNFIKDYYIGEEITGIFPVDDLVFLEYYKEKNDDPVNVLLLDTKTGKIDYLNGGICGNWSCSTLGESITDAFKYNGKYYVTGAFQSGKFW